MQFSSITINKDVTLRLSSKYDASPVFLLSQGAVVIEGSIDLDGEPGGAGLLPTAPGSGGYAGGTIGRPGHVAVDFKQNQFLVPLVGGVGGFGGVNCGGGAGGGAILIASATSITIRGSIRANGGKATGVCVPGAGGAIRLVAPTIDGDGTLSAQAGGPGTFDGRVRLETMSNYFTGTSETPATVGNPRR